MDGVCASLGEAIGNRGYWCMLSLSDEQSTTGCAIGRVLKCARDRSKDKNCRECL